MGGRGGKKVRKSGRKVKEKSKQQKGKKQAVGRKQNKNRPRTPTVPRLPTAGGAMSMAEQVRPLHDRLIVQLIEESEQQVGGIIIPETAKEKPQQGKVIAAGKGTVRDDGSIQPLDVKAGDTVLVGKYSGTEIKLDGEDYMIMREDEILGVIETDKLRRPRLT